MNQLFNEYGQKVRANIALNLHPFYLGKLERLASRIGSGIKSEEQRLIRKRAARTVLTGMC
ncbi:TPA: hypothetical protein ACN69T_005285, partial [Klebsiella pneumoniae]